MAKLSDRLQQILKAENLTIYGASCLVGAETDEPIKTVHRRITRYLGQTPKTWIEIETILEVLGYKIEIKKIK